MRTAVLYGKEDIRIEDRPVPEPGPGQMLVKIDYVGICGTDIEFYKLGQTPTLPAAVGGHSSRPEIGRFSPPPASPLYRRRIHPLLRGKKERHLS